MQAPIHLQLNVCVCVCVCACMLVCLCGGGGGHWESTGLLLLHQVIYSKVKEFCFYTKIAEKIHYCMVVKTSRINGQIYVSSNVGH